MTTSTTLGEFERAWGSIASLMVGLALLDEVEHG